tara:strand:+ start:771 stop:1358 length:588 start_codon:yes stop_codon:yes gene_type:complete
MALADRKPVDRHKITDETKLTRISQSFESGKHLELEAFESEAAMLYQIQELTDDVKEIHRYLRSEVTSNSTTNLSVTANRTSLTVNSSDGNNASLPAANTNNWGVMTDEIFDAVALNTAKVGYSSATISGSFTALSSSVASDIATNTAKVTYDKNLSNTNNMDVVMTVTENRGTYALVFTMTHGRVVKTATVALR